jgi:Mn2+/Fe2+ NRAMP family transporter
MAKPRPPIWHYFGPGIISGASDNDPTTVATLAVIGSTTIYGLGWLVLLVIPMLAIVQVISARIGAIAKDGLETASMRAYGRVVGCVVLVAVLATTFVTLAADLEGGGAAVQVLTGVDYRWWILPIGIGSLAMLMFSNYEKVKRFLIWIPLVFLAYPISAVLAHPDWRAVLAGSLVPHFAFTQDYTSGAIALLGTTLTSYAYVWQTIETAKERPPLARLGLVQADAALGTVVAGLSFWAIAIATGATLGIHHRTVQTANDAAQALQPIAGRYASTLFGVGLLGSALLAVPVLIATSAFMLNEMFGWNQSLDTKWWKGKKFYGSMAGMTLLASILGLAGVSPIKLLFVSSIIGGVGTPITLVVMLLVGRHKKVMGKHEIGIGLTVAGWCVAAIVILATGAYFASLLHH